MKTQDEKKDGRETEGRQLSTRGSHLEKGCGDVKWFGDRFVYIWGNQ